MSDIYLVPKTELYHYGIKGMKWGVRRFQDKDGRLTKSGRKRYSDDSENVSEEERIKMSTAKKVAIGAACITTVLAVYGGYKYASYKSATIRAGKDAVDAYTDVFKQSTYKTSPYEMRWLFDYDEDKIISKMKDRLDMTRNDAISTYHRTYSDKVDEYVKSQKLNTIIDTIRNRQKYDIEPDIDKYMSGYSKEAIRKGIEEGNRVIEAAKKTGRKKSEIARDIAYEKLKDAFSEPIKL